MCADDENAAKRQFQYPGKQQTMNKSGLLEWRRVLPSSHSARAIDGADGAACVAVSATMCHALSSSVRINIISILVAVGWDRRDGDGACHCR